MDRLKRLTLLVDPAAVIHAVEYPVTDPAGSVTEMLGLPRDARFALRGDTPEG